MVIVHPYCLNGLGADECVHVGAQTWHCPSPFVTEIARASSMNQGLTSTLTVSVKVLRWASTPSVQRLAVVLLIGISNVLVTVSSPGELWVMVWVALPLPPLPLA